MVTSTKTDLFYKKWRMSCWLQDLSYLFVSYNAVYEYVTRSLIAILLSIVERIVLRNLKWYVSLVSKFWCDVIPFQREGSVRYVCTKESWWSLHFVVFQSQIITPRLLERFV